MPNRKKRRKNISRRLQEKKALNSQIFAFFTALYILTFIAFILPIRPSYSESEKRQLSSFPSFSADSLFEGKFFDGINTWFADTFPLREQWVDAYASLKHLYGFSGDAIYGDVVQGDEIPQAGERPDTALDVSSSENTESTATESSKPAKISNNNYNLETQTLGAIYIAGDSAYEFYNFSSSLANSYADVINTFSKQLQGKANIYEMIVPTSTAITLPDNIMSTINSSDQEKSINYIYSLMDKNIHTIDAYSNIMLHRNEYVYFRTDHHWTALGAYYAYEPLMKAAGKAPVSLASYKTIDFPGFLGSFYSDSGKDPALSKNPDTVTAYLPTENASFVYTNKAGDEINWKVINDVSDYSSGMKYAAFIGGDNPYSVIENGDLHDGSSCVVVKESFGNALIPFLVSHYQTVHVIDYRYYGESLSKFVTSNNVKDVIFINNISMTRSESLINSLNSIT